ncbi:MAG: ATP-dependent zinc metalloprotease FtsH, partial [Pirellulaceae bacterium]|nr:ATP-dependent zinc metalloprotease FtsH [Pirellulaceae bacterium]
MPDPKANESDKQDRSSDDGSGGGNGRGNRPGRTPNFRMSRGAMGWIMIGGLVLLLLLVTQSASRQATSISPPEFFNLVTNGAFVEPVIVEKTRLVGLVDEQMKGLPPKIVPGGRVAAEINEETIQHFVEKLEQGGQAYRIDSSDSILVPLLISWGPFILIAILIYFFLFRSLRNAGGGAGMLGSFGRSRHKVMNKEHSDVRLDDVAGIDEAKDEVNEIIEFLKNPKKFQRLGGRVPRGVLLIGAPGCGKTLLARAVAGEADVPFFSISGSDFVEMFVGVGASRVRDLFKQAKDSSPCIIFLDEIDAVGRRRGSGFTSGGHDEREQTLNAILVEMDGFESSDQVIVMAATNRSDVLDPALIRPGRFDRQITVPLPDLRGRVEILKVHSQRVKMSTNVDLATLARGTPMFSGADLAAIINEAAIGATLQGKDWVEQPDLEEARDKVRWGRARKSHRIEEDEKKVIAYHEAGHAVVMYMDKHADPLHKVTIIPRGQALGLTFMLPEKDRHIYTRKQLLAQLRVTFGGRIAEQMFCNDISSGAAMDIKQATTIARTMITEYGMSEKLGFQLLSADENRQPWEPPERV